MEARESVACKRRGDRKPQAMGAWDLKLGVLDRRRGGSYTERRRHELQK